MEQPVHRRLRVRYLTSAYGCIVCPREFPGFRTMMALRHHLTKVHHVNVSFRAQRVMINGREHLLCTWRGCVKTFTSAAKLRKHFNTVHRNLGEARTCECGKPFKNAGYLYKHTQAVHPTCPPVTCNVCNRTYKTKGLLRKHQKRSHPADGPAPAAAAN